MSTIRAGTTTTTALQTTGDTTGNITLTPDSGLLTVNSTGALGNPSGTTGQRPGSPIAGQQRWNTTTGSLEIYSGSAWGSVGGGGPGALQAVQTSNFAAVSGNVYPVNTTSGAITITLPASPVAGNFFTITDYARTFTTNPCTLDPNGNKIGGSTVNSVLGVSGTQLTLMYVDSTQGWLQLSGSTVSIAGAYTISMLLVAGGGSGAGQSAGGGGGGGAGGVIYQSAIAVSPATAYSVVIGGGGTNGTQVSGSSGSNSTGFTYTAIGGGACNGTGASGGSGGAGTSSAGSGTAGQGFSGGLSSSDGATYTTGGGGGGATAVGTNANSSSGGNGGAGYTSSISGSALVYGGGGGGGGDQRGPKTNGTGGTGGGGGGNYIGVGGTGTANTGGGGGGSGYSGGTGGNGGSGICIVSYPGAQRGTGGTVTSSGGYTIHTFTSSGTYTA